MLSRRLAALIVVAAWVFAIAPAAWAQYAEGLPPGILSVEVDGQPINAVTTPVTDNATPAISGRVELGVPTIELAVADGEVIRFPAAVEGRGRFREPVPQPLPDGQYTLYINDVLIGAFTVEGATERERRPGRLLDIARVVPYPLDAGEVLPGFGFLDGRFFSLEEEAVRTAGAGDGASAAEVRETQRGLAEAGWLQRYENRLAAPSADNPDIFTVQITSFVVEYASGADARSAFALLAGDDPGVEFATIGDESVLTLLTGTTPDTGAAYQAARFVFRVGPLLGMIVYADLLDQPPDLTLLQAIGQSVAERGTVVVAEQSVALGSMTLRLDSSTASGRLTRRDLYEVRAGTLTALYNEDDATRASRVELFTGTTDAFSSTSNGTFSAGDGQNRTQTGPTQPAAPIPTSVISVEGEAPTPEPAATPPTAVAEGAAAAPATAQVFFASSLYAFPGETEADAWLTAQRQGLVASAQAGGGTFTEVTDGPTFGDASATFSTRRAVGAGEETAGGFRMYARVGAIVAVLDAGSVPNLPLEAATSLMQSQVACIEEGGCTGLAPLPPELLGAAGEAPSAEPAAVDVAATPTPGSVIIVEGEETAGEGEGTAGEGQGASAEDRAARQATREARQQQRQQERQATEVPVG